MNNTRTSTRSASSAPTLEPIPRAPLAATVMDLYGAIAAGDVAGLAAAVGPDVALHVPGTHDLAGTHIGPEGFLRLVIGSRERTDDGEHIEVLDVLEGAEHAAAYCRVRATRAGRVPLDNYTLHLFRFKEGRIAEVWLHNRNDFAVNEFWS